MTGQNRHNWPDFFCQGTFLRSLGQERSQRVSPGSPPIKMLFQIFRLNLAETCLKCTILVTSFQKTPSAGAFLPPASLNLQYWWLEVLGQISGFWSYM